MQGAIRVITLKLRLDGQSPTGRASTPGNTQREFAGWLGLIAAIEALAGGDRETAAAARRDGNEKDVHDGALRELPHYARRHSPDRWDVEPGEHR